MKQIMIRFSDDAEAEKLVMQLRQYLVNQSNGYTLQDVPAENNLTADCEFMGVSKTDTKVVVRVDTIE